MSTPLPTSYASIPYKQILVSHHPPSSPVPTALITITLNRPHSQNAFTDTMAHELTTLFPLLSLDPRVKAIILTGSGERSFCAGADLSDRPFEYGSGSQATREHRDGGGRVVLAIHRCSKPVVAAVNGNAVGVGVTMTSPCCVRVGSEGAKVGFVFARRGIVMEAASSFFLPRLIGYSRAIHLVTTGAVYQANHPLLRELFSEVVPQDQVLPRAIAIAEEIANNTSVVSTKLMRDMMYHAPPSAEATHLLDSKILLELFNSEDKKEGIDSFFQKRRPDFKGTMEKDAPGIWPWWEVVDTRVGERGVLVGEEAEGKAKAKL